MKSAIAELAEMIEAGTIKNADQLEKAKIEVARKYGLDTVVKNSAILDEFKLLGKENKYRMLLKTKPVRTLSGVANISVMWLDKSRMLKGKYYSCPYQCIYCAQGELAPKSYTGVEPTTLRAIRNDYDPYKQVANRIKQLQTIGHSTDKCELIIMGGTFLTMPISYQDNFIKGCFDGFNGFVSSSLEESQTYSETAPNRCVGLTIETRSDWCSPSHIGQMLSLGTTRVEIGVQTTDDALQEKSKRGNTCQQNIDAIKLLKDAGLKVTAHWMPGLTGLEGKIDEKKELIMFEHMFSDPDYRPDEIKIYPTLVIPGTELHDMWKKGNYAPLEKEQMISLLIEMKKLIPSYVRLKRVMRDISEHKAEAGAKTTNLRQLAQQQMNLQRQECTCIRCREIRKGDINEIKLKKIEYEASKGKEIFLSFESEKALLGFLRLRLCKDVARIRELHIYGEMTPFGKKATSAQHRGLGKRLMEEAEQIASESGFVNIIVTSGVGVREYYKNLGYYFESPYMAKELKA